MARGEGWYQPTKNASWHRFKWDAAVQRFVSACTVYVLTAKAVGPSSERPLPGEKVHICSRCDE